MVSAGLWEQWDLLMNILHLQSPVREIRPHSEVKFMLIKTAINRIVITKKYFYLSNENISLNINL